MKATKTIFQLLLVFFSSTALMHPEMMQKEAGSEKHQPIIDMHIHAHSFSRFPMSGSICTGDQDLIFPGIDTTKPFEFSDLATCKVPIQAAPTEKRRLTDTLEMFERYNIRRAVTSGDLLDDWINAAPDRIIPGFSFASRDLTAEEYRMLYKQGKFTIFAEVEMQYQGLRPDDELYEPYFALAEELDIPLGIHLGEGPIGGVHILGPSSAYRASLGSPFMLEQVLIRHRKLRVYVMHYGSPLVDEMIAMLFSHPNLYVDIACNDWFNPRKQFYEHLRKMVEAGFEKRIMFGSDQMAWPETIAKAIESVENAPFLSELQKRDILYNNAARFLRLTKEDIERDHK